MDSKNDFNDINQIRMLWKIRHLWLSRARFLKLLPSMFLDHPAKRE